MLPLDAMCVCCGRLTLGESLTTPVPSAVVCSCRCPAPRFMMRLNTALSKPSPASPGPNRPTASSRPEKEPRVLPKLWTVGTPSDHNLLEGASETVARRSLCHRTRREAQRLVGFRE